jgi:hypothetical protein
LLPVAAKNFILRQYPSHVDISDYKNSIGFFGKVPYFSSPFLHQTKKKKEKKKKKKKKTEI